MERSRNILVEIASGRGRTPYLEDLETIAGELARDSGEGCSQIGRSLASALHDHRATLISHLEARYCPSGECDLLIGAPCQIACPAHVDAPTYLALVGAGRYKDALNVLLEDLPIPGSLGRVCVHPCEKACRRGEVDAPISICRLKRTAFDKAHEQGFALPEPVPKGYVERIAVIGSGPAGLSAAYFLAKEGYRPTIFEAMPEPGGMLRWGIPAYRLPRHILRTEIDHIKALGVEIRTKAVFGKDLDLDRLRARGYKAVFLGVGAWAPIKLGIKGAEKGPQVIDGLAFLRDGALQKTVAEKRVIVVGGGNAALDCVRTALRLNVSRAHLVYRRSRREMPAHPSEVDAAEREGAALTYLTSPLRVVAEDGAVTGLECVRNELSEPDATGRRRPVPVQGSEFVIQTDVIISAIGQQVDLSNLEKVEGLSISRYNLLTVNGSTMETSVPGVFAGGDAVTGPATVIEAVAAGRKAARSIHCYLKGLPLPEHLIFPRRPLVAPVMTISADEKSRPVRSDMPEIEVERRRAGFDEVELGLGVAAAVEEAKRCLRCDICISCGRCVHVCRDEMDVDAIHLSYVKEHGSEATDFLRPAEQCIGCGACAVNCPTGAIVVADSAGERKIAMCGGEMSRHSLVECAACGVGFIAKRHLDYIQRRSTVGPRTKYPSNLCPACARRARVAETASVLSV
jgi:NADPH-dependent glutamate synthase beta subunit-like oxidoreductase